MNDVRLLIGDIRHRINDIPDQSVDLIVTSPPFLALRSYLPDDHPNKTAEIGSEATPAEFIDALLDLTAEWRRVLAPHGSIAVELGDTYAGSGGGGGDYLEGGWREGQHTPGGSSKQARKHNANHARQKSRNKDDWPQPKSLTLIPELYRIGLAYGINPLTGNPSPAGQWRVRNVIRWVRTNPPVGALGDKWRPATSTIVVACLSKNRYWDDIATRKPHSPNTNNRSAKASDGIGRTDLPSQQHDGNWSTLPQSDYQNPAGAPLLDWWQINNTGTSDAHYATYPPQLVEPLVKAMTPHRVCTTCGEPSRRIVSTDRYMGSTGDHLKHRTQGRHHAGDFGSGGHTNYTTVGWSDCRHNTWRPGHVLDPFAGTGTTLAVAHGHGHNATGIDLDERNIAFAESHFGGLFGGLKVDNGQKG